MKMLKIRLLCVFLTKMSAYRKDFDETKYISFLIKDNELLEKFNDIWDKISYASGNEIDSNRVYNKKYLRTEKKWKNKHKFP